MPVLQLGVALYTTGGGSVKCDGCTFNSSQHFVRLLPCSIVRTLVIITCMPTQASSIELIGGNLVLGGHTEFASSVRSIAIRSDNDLDRLRMDSGTTLRVLDGSPLVVGGEFEADNASVHFVRSKSQCAPSKLCKFALVD